VFEVINNEIRIAIQRQGEREWGDLYKRGMVSNIQWVSTGIYTVKKV
jgi:hypothetical protein